VVIWAKKSQILGAIIPRITVYVIDVQRSSTGFRSPLIPTADATFFAARFHQIPANVGRRFIKACGSALDLACLPSFDVLLVLKSHLALQRAKARRIPTDGSPTGIPTANGLIRHANKCSILREIDLAKSQEETR